MIYKDYYRNNKGSKWHAFTRWLFDKVTSIWCPTGRFICPIEEVKKEDIKKVLLICNGHIGDTVMSTAIFREIRKSYPDIKLTVICSKLAYPILEKNPYIDEIIAPSFKMAGLFSWNKKEKEEYNQLIKRLKKEEFDVAVAVRSDIFNIIYLAYMSDSKNTFGYYNLDGGKAFLTHPMYYPEDEQHATLADLNLIINALKLKYILPAPPYDEEVMKAMAFPEIHNDPNIEYDRIFEENYICIAPGSCAKLQTWDRMKYKAIIEWMSKDYPDYKIILAGGKEDEELINMLSLYNSKCIKLINCNLRRLGTLFNQSKCVLLQDGGPMHIAYTMMKEADKRLIVLWGPNPLAHVAPLRGHLIHHPLPCYPCMRQEKECKMPEGKRCMDLISIEEVKKAIGEAINGNKKRNS